MPFKEINDYLSGKKIIFVAEESIQNMHKVKNKEFKIFFESFFIPLCQFAGRYMGQTEEAADIAQEAFVKMYERWEEFDTELNARAFLYTAARNLCLDRIKHKKAEVNYQHYCCRENDSDDFVFLKEVTRQETFRMLYAAINQLPAQTRQIMILCMEGVSNGEVADKLGISVNTVKTLKKNAYTVLRKLLVREYMILLLVMLREI